MSNVLKTVDDAMSVVIGWIDAPLVSTVGMAGVSDSVGNEVSHAWISMLHVHLDSEAAFSFCVSTLSHMLKELKVLFDAGVSVWRVDFIVSCLTHLLSRLEAHVSFAFFDEPDSHIKELLEVV